MRWLLARAHDNGLFVLFSDGRGCDDDEVRTGNAMVLDPYGRIVAETWIADDAMVVAYPYFHAHEGTVPRFVRSPDGSADEPGTVRGRSESGVELRLW